MVEGIGLSREEERLICQYCIDFRTDELSEEIIERAKSFNKQLTEKISSTYSSQVIELKSEYVSAFFKVKSLPRSCFHSREVETYYKILAANPRDSKRCEVANEWLRIHLNRQPNIQLLVALQLICEEWPNDADYDFLKAVIEYDSRSENEWEINNNLNDHIKNYYSVRYEDEFEQFNNKLKDEAGKAYVMNWLQNASRYGDANGAWMRALILNAKHGYNITKVEYDYRFNQNYYLSEEGDVLSDFYKFDESPENIEVYGYLLEDPSSENHERAKAWLRLATWLMPTNTFIQAFNFLD